MTLKLQKSEVKRAIEKSGGIISVIARKLGCGWHTAEKYIKEFDLQEDYDNEKETILDLAESNLIKNIQDQDNTAIIFYLKTKGKSRGYVERQEIISADTSLEELLDLS